MDTNTAVDKPEGPISAAIIAGGAGIFTLGLLTTLAEANTAVKDFLQWTDRVGPLSGKTSLAVVVWVVSWLILHMAMINKAFETKRTMLIAIILIGLGVIGTFPPFFQAFAK